MSYNILDYGADPTGVEDSYPAIMAAIAAAKANRVNVNGTYSGLGDILFPPGRYGCSQSIVHDDGAVNFRGHNSGLAGGDNSILVFPASSKGLQF